ncbi:MAG: hypothetical protein V4438_01625 [Patescibacteria group bacterium]
MNKITNKNTIIKIVILLVVAGLSFFGGIKYATSKSSMQNRGGFAGAGSTARFRGGAGGGSAAMGQVLSKDNTGITIKLRNGGSQIILMASSTQVMKSVTGSASDIVVGGNVTILGTANSDGSFTANSVQIRPQAL